MQRRFRSRTRLPARLTTPDGLSLIDALVAIVVLVIVTAGVAHLLLWGRRAAWSAGTKSLAVTMAVQKMENLQSLLWEVDAEGTPLSDETTDLSANPVTLNGTGLRPSPANALSANTAGFADYLDTEGRWVGNGTRPPGRAAFVRRWSIEPFTSDQSDTMVITVLVLPHIDEARATGFLEQGVRLMTIRTRVARR